MISRGSSKFYSLSDVLHQLYALIQSQKHGYDRWFHIQYKDCLVFSARLPGNLQSLTVRAMHTGVN